MEEDMEIPDELIAKTDREMMEFKEAVLPLIRYMKKRCAEEQHTLEDAVVIVDDKRATLYQGKMCSPFLAVSQELSKDQ